MSDDKITACYVIYKRPVYRLCFHRDKHYRRLWTNHGETAGKDGSYICQIYGDKPARLRTFPYRRDIIVFSYRASFDV